MATKLKKPLTVRQETYIDEKLKGRSPSAILGRVGDCDRSEKVQRELAVQQHLLAEEVEITRADVITGIRGAIDRAKLQAEPATEIAGWREIGKILGHYAPEVKKLTLSDEQDKVVRKLETLSTQELLAMVEKKRQIRNATVMEGESVNVSP